MTLAIGHRLHQAVAAVPVEAGLEESALRIKVVQNRVRIFLVGCGEHDDLEVPVGLKQAFAHPRPDVDPSVLNVFGIRELDGDDDVGVLRANVVDTVNQGFIHVEGNRLTCGRVLKFG